MEALADHVPMQSVIESQQAHALMMSHIRVNGYALFPAAIDFSRENTRSGEEGVTIYAYMGHHQGMSLLALDDALHRDVIRERFHADVRVRAVESILFERVPSVKLRPEEVETTTLPARSSASEEPVERTWKEITPVPRVHLHGNGRYALMITNSGAGYSRWNEFDVTRWRSDSARDAWGAFLYIRDAQSGMTWAVAAQPTGG